MFLFSTKETLKFNGCELLAVHSVGEGPGSRHFKILISLTLGSSPKWLWLTAPHLRPQWIWLYLITNEKEDTSFFVIAMLYDI